MRLIAWILGFFPTSTRQPASPHLSGEEVQKLSRFIRGSFPPEQWPEITQQMLEYMGKIESELPLHFVMNGSETHYQLLIPRDSHRYDREGNKIGMWLGEHYRSRGYAVYSTAKELNSNSPDAKKYGRWAWNLQIAAN